MILSCSPPPSANKLWQRTKNGMTKSREYRQWLSGAGWQIKAQGVRGCRGPVQVSITAPANGKRDLDNHCKGAIDLICSLKLIDSDRFKTVKRITMEWHDKPAMLIQIEPWRPGQSSLVMYGPQAMATVRGQTIVSTPL